MSETSRIEYKRELNDEVDLEKEVIAFLNYKEGGSIYFGTDKYDKTVGVSDIDGDMLKIKNRIKDNIIPSAMGLFDDRIEITSAGGLPEALNEEEFFMGYSVPRNLELMRIYKDLELVEHLGSGVPRILETYSKECFLFTENFIRMVFPNAWNLSEEVQSQPNTIQVPFKYHSRF